MDLEATPLSPLCFLLCSGYCDSLSSMLVVSAGSCFQNSECSKTTYFWDEDVSDSSYKIISSFRSTSSKICRFR